MALTSFTYSSHPVACCRWSANLDIMERENLVGNSQKSRGYFKENSVEAFSDHPLVGGAGVGLVAAVEFVKDKAKKTPLILPKSCCAHEQTLLKRKGDQQSLTS
ncbi:MAG: hypothetical protein R2865_17680 [Deinococcales bacterium]